MEPEDLIKILQKENEELRRKDAVEDMVSNAQIELANRVKKVGALITAGLAIMGFATFQAFVTTVSKNIDEQASSTIVKDVTKKASQDVTKQVSISLLKKFNEDSKFQDAITKVLAETLSKDQELKDKVTRDPVLQDKIISVVEETVRKTLSDISKQSTSSNFAQTVTTSYAEELYFVVSGSSNVKSDLERDVLGKARSNSFNAQICPPKKDKQRYALIVSDKPKLPMSHENAVKVRDNARKIVQSDAYILSEKSAFFNCIQKSS